MNFMAAPHIHLNALFWRKVANLDETDDIVDLSSSDDVDSSSAVTSSVGGILYSNEDNVAEDIMVEARVKDGIGDSGESERNNPGIGDVERSSFLMTVVSSSFTKVAGDVSLLDRVLLVLITMILPSLFTYDANYYFHKLWEPCTWMNLEFACIVIQKPRLANENK